MAREIGSREGTYHQRVKVETVHSVEKRLMGSHVLARQTAQQHKELIFRAFSYNSRRMETLFSLFIEDFFRALSAGLQPKVQIGSYIMSIEGNQNLFLKRAININRAALRFLPQMRCCSPYRRLASSRSPHVHRSCPCSRSRYNSRMVCRVRTGMQVPSQA